MQQEVAGFWRSLALYGRAEHRGEIPLQFDSELTVGRRHDDRVDQASERLRGFRAGFWVLQSLGERRDLLSVQVGHFGVEQRRRLVRSLELSLQSSAASIERLDLGFALVHGDLVVEHEIEELLDPRTDPLDFALR